MPKTVDRPAAGRLEGSCGASARDWLRFAPPAGAIQRVEAFFAGHAFDPHRHDTYALGITLSGVQRFDYRGAEATSLTGDLIVVHPDERHNGRAGSVEGFRYRMGYVEPSLVAAALQDRASALPFVRRAVLDDRRLRHALARLLSGFDRKPEPLEAAELVVDLADALLALDPSAQRPHSGAATSAAVDHGRAFLDAHHDRVVASDELEAVTGLSRFELARQFRRRLGTTPYRYLTMRRLDRTRALIRSGSSLAEAAADAGFADQSHMTRQFGAAFGLSPGRWRSMMQVRGARDGR
jgi:AraC-like DNA-binding protein